MCRAYGIIFVTNFLMVAKKRTTFCYMHTNILLSIFVNVRPQILSLF
jgi:hypothetical protein